MGSVGVLYCRATGKPIATVQWYNGDFPSNPIPSYFQQVLLVPTDTPHTTVYTCVGINYAGNKKHTRFANITVIVEGKHANLKTLYCSYIICTKLLSLHSCNFKLQVLNLVIHFLKLLRMEKEPSLQ